MVGKGEKKLRLIDADELIVMEYGGIKFVPKEFIDDAPTVDAVEVVRCKDCKWFNDFGCAIRIVDDSDKPTENDYCSFGERKDG